MGTGTRHPIEVVHITDVAPPVLSSTAHETLVIIHLEGSRIITPVMKRLIDAVFTP